MEDKGPTPTKRVRKSCERCRTRKQRCAGFPVCSNCMSAKEDCKQPPSAIEEYRSGPNQALLERISHLESQLASYTNVPPPAWINEWSGDDVQDRPISPAASHDEGRKGSIADVVGFLSLGGERAYVGASSGFAMASSLGQMVQATVWNKALAATVGDHQSKMASLAELKKNSSGPPDDKMGGRILEAYFLRTHHRYPFLDRSDIMDLHVNRFEQLRPSTPSEQFGKFKLYMVYAIGATLLKLTESYDYTAPESFFMTALQYISAAREFNSIANVQAMALLVLYNLRSPSNSGIFFMVGLGMRTCVDLGLHREASYKDLPPYEGQLQRRLFWSVYFLERVIAVSLGRPYSIADRDIDAALPLEIDDTIRDDGLISRTQAVAPSPTFQASQPSSNLTLGVQCIRLMRIESYIQTKIYRVDMPPSSLISKLSRVLSKLEDFKSTVPALPPSEADYLAMHYYKAVRLAIQPFLNMLPSNDPRISVCLHASGQISQIFKRLHQRDSYGHSFIALHSVFIAGVTMCYCLFLSPSLWDFPIAEDLRACSSALFVMAERTPSVKKYRDALETVISAAMEYLGRVPVNFSPAPPTNHSTPASTEQFPCANGTKRRHDIGSHQEAGHSRKRSTFGMRPPPPPPDPCTSSAHCERATQAPDVQTTSTYATCAAAPWQRESFIRSPATVHSSLLQAAASLPSSSDSLPSVWKSSGLSDVAVEGSDFATAYTPFTYDFQAATPFAGEFDEFRQDRRDGHSVPEQPSSTSAFGPYAVGPSSYDPSRATENSNRAGQDSVNDRPAEVREKRWEGTRDGGSHAQAQAQNQNPRCADETALPCDTDWLLGFCEGDAFNFQMLNEMMKFDVGGVGNGVFDVRG